MGKRIKEYRQNIEAFNDVFLRPEDSRLKQVAVILTGLMVSLPESKVWRAFPDVDSPEFLWDGPDFGQDVLESELGETLGESRSAN
jgi:hypothetical protein